MIRPAALVPVAALAAATLAAPAISQAVARAEHGAIPLALGEPVGLDAPATARAGDTVWTDQVRPAQAVRLTQEAPDRRGPGRFEAVPVGSLLYGVSLSGGMAWCQRINLEAAVRRVQCFRDFNGDGTFDGGYVTEHDGLRTQIVPSMLRSLTAVRQTAYEPADAAELDTVEARWVFERWHDGQPEFRMWVEGERLDERHACEPYRDQPDACVIAGLLLQVSQAGDGGMTAVLLGQAPERRLSIITSGVL